MKKAISNLMFRVIRFIGDRSGMTLMEKMAILGVSLLILGATYIAAQTPITTWWNAKIMTLFP